MPPKPRFTKEEIVQAGLSLVSREGAEHLTARELAKELGSSSQPIFTVFDDMGEVREAVRKAANEMAEAFDVNLPQSLPGFRLEGMRIVMFAMEEPNLFKMAFMSEGKTLSFEEAFASHGGATDGLIGFIMRAYDISLEDARLLFQHVWVFTYGLGMLCATGTCTFSTEEISEKLGNCFLSMMAFIKMGKPQGSPMEMPTEPPEGLAAELPHIPA